MADGVNACITRDNQAKPTAHFLPQSTNAYDLGSSSFSWRNIYGTLSNLFISYPQTTAELAASVTPVNLYIPSHDVTKTVILKRYGGDPTGASDNSTAIANAELVSVAAGGLPIIFDAGNYRCNTGITKKTGVNWQGSGKYTTNLKFYGSGVFINAVGTSVSVATRIICTISDMTLDGTNASNINAECIKMGWNMRSNPFLARVRLYNFPNHGLHFSDQNWNVDFNDVEVDTCGHDVGNNASGIYKDAAVDGGTFNGITFNNVQVEGCGSSTSTAGGVNMQTTTANRGLYFNDSIIEGNFGSLQVYITNMSDLQFKNLYMEGIVATGQTALVEIDGGGGGINGGYLTGSGGTAQIGIQVKASAQFQIDALTFASLSTAGLDLYGSTVRVGHNPGITTRLDSTAQLIGEICPRFGANKNGTNQTAIATGVFTKVTFTTEEYDETNAFASSTFTPQAVGRCQLDAAVTWTAAVDQTQLIISIYRSGAAYKSRQYQANGTGTQTVAISALCDSRNTSETFEIYVRQSSGSNKDISGATDETYFMGTLIR
jgi:hypothetical protein